MPRFIILDANGVEITRVIAPAAQVAAFCDDGQTYELEAEADFAPERIARFAAAEARRYLAETDWYVTRFTETGEAIPQNILDARAAWRLAASKEGNTP